MLNWENTKKIYILVITKRFKKSFSTKIKYDDLSLWWLTKLIDKDFILIIPGIII